jgi:nucleoside-diphosphate-sugar epimerase
MKRNTRVVVIGGTGHIGSFLTPMLVEAGYEVVCVSRGLKAPYHEDATWSNVLRVDVDRTEDEVAGSFGERIASLDADVVIDLTCYTPESARQLVESLRGRVKHFLHCGTIWVHGHCVEAPTREDAPRTPFGEYGIRKAAIEKFLLETARESDFPATILHPGHLVGRGWNPINPQGNFNSDVFSEMLHGEGIALPNMGMETVHHVHVEDVARAFVQAVARRTESVGESFHIVSAAALTLRGYAEGMFKFFKQPIELRFLPYETWRETVSEKDARATLDHISHSPCCSISKARQLLGYAPRYSSLSAVQQSVEWLQENGVIPGV